MMTKLGDCEVEDRPFVAVFFTTHHDLSPVLNGTLRKLMELVSALYQRVWLQNAFFCILQILQGKFKQRVVISR